MWGAWPAKHCAFAVTLPAAFGMSCPIAHVRERLNVSSGKACNSQNLYLRPPDRAASVVVAWNADLSAEEAVARNWLVGRGADSSARGPADVQSPGTSPGPALQSISRRTGMDVHSLRVRLFPCLVKRSEGSEISMYLYLPLVPSTSS